MNSTAEKLREAANYMTSCGANSAHAIATVHGLFDVVESDTFGEDLGAVLDVIADEMDELQAKANDANNLRQKLDSAEKKAERRKKQVEHTEDAIRERNARLKMRAELLEQAVNENRELRKQVPTERERHILDMWPRFEDGKPVMVGDEVDGLGGEIIEVYIAENAAAIWNNYGNHMHLSLGERVNRPAPKVLDADGVEIKADDTVWHEDGSELHVIGFGDVQDGETMLVVKYAAGPTKWGAVRCLSVTHTRPAPKVLDADGVEIHVGDTVWHCIGIDGELVVEEIDDESGWVSTRSANGACLSVYNTHLTHTRPDSWERLEEDAGFNDETGIVGGNLDIVRRAKALAGVEVDE